MNDESRKVQLHGRFYGQKRFCYWIGCVEDLGYHTTPMFCAEHIQEALDKKLTLEELKHIALN